MTTLASRLDRIREDFEAKTSRDALAAIRRATADLESSGILHGVVAPGDALPSFELDDVDGTTVTSADLLSRGPLVLSFYRGHW